MLVVVIIVLAICAVLFMRRRKNKKQFAGREQEEMRDEQSRSIMNADGSYEEDVTGAYADEKTSQKTGITSRVQQH